ncbi:MAG: ribosome recycling factor [Candidatus Saccharimonadales bacterium]
MNPSQYVDKVPGKLNGLVLRFQDELKKIRTGRAHPSMLDGVLVAAYGTQMPLNQIATVVVLEAQLLQITPFDPNNLQLIASAIRNNQSLGLNPTDDGRVVRVAVPLLTEERRRDLTKQVGQKQEECMVSLRNVRHEAINVLDKAKRDKQVSEDDAKRLERQVDDSMNKAREAVENTAKSKEQEIMTV